MNNSAKLIVLNGEGGRIDAADIDHIAVYKRSDVHRVQPAAASITQETEASTVYGLDELGAISQVCRVTTP